MPSAGTMLPESHMTTEQKIARRKLSLLELAADRARLEAVVSDRNSPQKYVWRAPIVLLTADGCGTTEIMRCTGVQRWVSPDTDRL